jgi:hypothetical protein
MQQQLQNMENIRKAEQISELQNKINAAEAKKKYLQQHLKNSALSSKQRFANNEAEREMFKNFGLETVKPIKLTYNNGNNSNNGNNGNNGNKGGKKQRTNKNKKNKNKKSRRR